MRLVKLVLAMLLAIAVLLPDGAAAERRVALVVGNSSYAHTAQLSNPLNDARDIAAALKATGFEVIEALNTDKRNLDGALRSFTEKLADADVALFYYAGHGLQVGAQNYLLPVDAKLERERDLDFEAVKLEFVMRQMEIDRDGKTTIVILDACRDNPLSRNLARSMGTRSTAIGRGLAPAATGLGSFIAYATQPGNVALDGTGRNSPFTAALAKHIKVKGRNLPATMIEVRKDVVAATKGKQVPWDHSALTGDFYFVPGDAAPQRGTVSAAPAGTAEDVAALRARLAKLEAEAKARERPPGGVTTWPGSIGTSATKPIPGLPRLPTGVATGKAVPAPAANLPPLKPQLRPQLTSPYFDETDNVALAGEPIRVVRTPSPAACSEACETEPGCVGYQHGKKATNMGQCQLFKTVAARQEDQSWRSGVRKPGSSPVVLTPPQLLSVKPDRQERGFNVWDNATLVGTVIKSSAAESTASCATVCQNTPGCTAATFTALLRGQSNACTVMRSVIRADRGTTGNSALVRAN